MRLNTLGAALSALALAGSLGVAAAQQNNRNNADQHSAASESISPAEQTRLAYSAAGLLRGQMVVDRDQRIPQAIVNHAYCIAVFPGVFKEGFIVAGSHGDGIASCRNRNGDWSAPAYFNLSAGSVGFQAGAKMSQQVMLFMTNDAVKQLMNGNFKFGGNIGVAAGPLGLRANVHTLPAETIAYTLSQSGGFAGAELKGTTISADQKATQKIYGQDTSIKEVLFQRRQAPGRLRVFNAVLSHFAPASQFSRQPLPVQKSDNQS